MWSVLTVHWRKHTQKTKTKQTPGGAVTYLFISKSGYITLTKYSAVAGLFLQSVLSPVLHDQDKQKIPVVKIKINRDPFLKSILFPQRPEKVVHFSRSQEKARSVLMCHQESRWEDDPVFVDALVSQLLSHLIVAALHLVYSSRKIRVKTTLLLVIKDFPFHSCCSQHPLLVFEI